MSDSPRYAGLAAKLLDRAAPAAASPPSPAVRAKDIAAVALAVRASRRRRRARIVGTSIAIAACTVLGLGFAASKWRRSHAPPVVANGGGGATRPAAVMAHALEGRVTTVHAGSETPLGAGAPLGVGDRLRVEPDGRGAVVLANGTQLVVEGGGSLAVVDPGATHTFALETGAVRAFVTKLPEGERFLVRTEDAEIEVRGTAFRVMKAASDPTCGAGSTTRLDVFEGVVVVRSQGTEARVSAGEQWPKGCANVGPAVAFPVATGATVANTAASPPKGTVSPPSSDLAAQNEAFAEAIAAKRRGDLGVALGAFDRFLARYPTSTLVESAVAERFKILAVTDRKAAVAAARDYLNRFPTGPARADAQAVLAKGESPTSPPAKW